MDKHLHNILVISQHYWPEPFPAHAFCEALAERGFHVHVITDVPNYPHGRIYEGYRHGRRRNEKRNGVMITRVFTVPRRSGVLFRAVNYYSFVLSSCFRILFLQDQYDLILIIQSSPVMMAYAGLLYGRLHRKKVMLYCLDLWPASLKAGGISEESLLYRMYSRVSRRIYRAADRILTASSGFMEVMHKEFGIDQDKMNFLPQIPVCEETGEYSYEDPETMNAVFIGNIGQAQCMDVLLHAAAIIERMGISDHGRPVWFRIIGDGTCFPAVRKLKESLGLKHVVLYGRKDPSEAVILLGRADCALITLTGEAEIAMTLPAKMQMYLNAGKPVIASADGEISRLIGAEHCGICVPAEEPRALAYALIRFLTSDRRAYSQNARQAYQRLFSRDAVIGQLVQEMKELCRS